MNASLAKNVRTLRDHKHWTQQHLADTAGAQLRTIQRVEKGEGASVETLGALANAFDVSIGLLQADLAAIAAQVQRQEEEFRKQHHIIQVSEVTSSASLPALGGVHMSMFHCPSQDDAVQDAFVRLQRNINDMADLWDDVDPVMRRDWAREAFEQVQALNELGFAVVTGTRDGSWQNMAVTTLYVVAVPRGEVKPYIAVAKAG